MDFITAVRNNDLERVKLILKQGAVDKDKGDSDGCLLCGGRLTMASL